MQVVAKENPGTSAKHGGAETKTAARKDWTKVVNVIVGTSPHAKDYIAHPDTLCGRSQYFRRALKDHWMEGQIGTVHLPDVNPDTFGHWLDHIYEGTLPYDLDSISAYKGADGKPTWDPYADLIRVYILADRLVDPKCKNKIISAMWHLTRTMDKDSCHWAPDLFNIKLAYEHTPEESSIRRLLVDCYLSRDHEDVEKEAGLMPLEFLRDFAVRLHGHYYAYLDPHNCMEEEADYLEEE